MAPLIFIPLAVVGWVWLIWQFLDKDSWLLRDKERH